jgi:NAD(P)-dependent dehydrogenase (short-subunit alcohol dehydrogenase family)
LITGERALCTCDTLLTGGGLALSPSAQYADLAIGKAGMRSLALSLAEELEPHGIHVATVTVAGGVQAGTYFAPELIAEVYWRLHAQLRGSWEREVVYRSFASRVS